MITVVNPDTEVKSSGVVQCHIVYPSIKSDLPISICNCMRDMCIKYVGNLWCFVYRRCTVTFGSLYLVA